MAVPDLSSLTEEELVQTETAARNERVRRNRFDEVEVYLRAVLGVARDANITKAQVGAFLTAVVNDVYSVPPNSNQKT